MKQEYIGKKVQFNIVLKDLKGKKIFQPQTGKIKSLNHSGNGFVISGISISGLYNRCIEDITLLDTGR